MLPLRWREAALEDLYRIIGHIAKLDLAAAEALRERIESVILPLSEHPYLYRPGRVNGTRELVTHPNYIVVYRVLSDCVEIVNILHAGSNTLDLCRPASLSGTFRGARLSGHKSQIQKPDGRGMFVS